VNSAYYFILIILVICSVVLFLILRSPFGSTLEAIRDNPQRCEAVGVNVRRHQLMAIVIATFFAGVAGVLFVVLEGSVFPDLLFWVLSLEVFIMCLLGGWFTFAGPILGAAIMVSLRTFVGIYTEYWTLILGIILILLIFFLPEGVMGYFIEKFKLQVKEVAERGTN
jgi:branched-chain amino acid transport system permease protein